MNAPNKTNPYNPRALTFAILMAVALGAVVSLSVSTGSYLEKYARKHATVTPISIDTADFAGRANALGEGVRLGLDENLPYTPTPAEIAALPASESVTIFSMNPDTRITPELSADEQAAIDAARSYFTDRGQTCSCLVIDLTTGRGISFDHDKRVYGASAFKGIVAAYVCEEQIDNGRYELGGSLQRLMESAVSRSDNDSYRTLKSGYAGGLAGWVADMGIDPTYVSRYRFPTYNAQESTALWAHIADYLNGEGDFARAADAGADGVTGTDGGTDAGADGGAGAGAPSDTAVWLGELYTTTNVSHIRAAVERGIADSTLKTGGEDAVVQNKAGWISGSTNSTTDAGLVHLNGHVYAVSIMTNAPDSSQSREAVTQLALEVLRALQ